MTNNTLLWLGKVYKGYRMAYYQNDLLSTFEKKYDLYHYGPGYGRYDTADSIHDILSKTPSNPDFIVISNTWEIQDESVDQFSLHTGLKLDEVDIPVLLVLNKEYKKLELKLDFISRNSIDYVTTVLKDRCQEWEAKTGATFIWEPFGIDLDRFEHDETLSKKYDFGFTGSIHEELLNERKEIKEHLFKQRYIEFSWWHNLVHKRRFEHKYDDLSIYWGEWNNKNLRWNSRAPFGEEYVKLLNQCKLFLNTLSAYDIFNPRFWELMATKTLIICPEDDYYGLLKDGVNCVMYQDLTEFDDLLHHYATDDQDRQEIVDNAYEQVQQYSWESVVEDLMAQITEA